MAPINREERRRIPLTAFALVTVPDDPMLSVYLREMEAIDISMEQRMCGATLEARSSSCAMANGPSPPRHVDNPSMNKDNLTGKVQASGIELELDKFMASLTATVSPDAVIKTIASTKGMHIHRRSETDHRKI
ncbi:hypothetical protein AYL99_03447 [Fonsecaea erecta]|uniref:Uncharacterized protein n=1 Tax=Fonsecaea erecta TaxID=1367422 RepID=A0A178ZPE0_9EURO|nr:hypothetical protein AYL99_03447 [Fonsecaea erecta]OAP61246.1 hypothetical protein AYL99_03447 [Fonsecaea erecta]